MSKEKQTYEENVEAKLDELNTELALMHDKQEQLSAEAKVEYGEQLEKLEAQREQAQARLEAVQEAGTDAWQELKQGMSEALETLETSVANARQRMERELS